MKDHDGVPLLDLTLPWRGPCGGLPPLSTATPEAIEAAAHKALAMKREEIATIVANPDAPDFVNTVEAFENCGRALQRVFALYALFSSNKNIGSWTETGPRLAPMFSALDDEIAHNEALFARLGAVPDDGLSGEQLRLKTVIIDRMKRRGAGLPNATLARLIEVNGEIAQLIVQFNQNLITDQDGQAVFVADAVKLDGYPDAMKQAAAAVAETRGRPGEWAIVNTRPAIWPLLQTSADRALREQVWRMWTSRGAHDGPSDNRPIISRILELRGDRAKLLGFETYADYALSNRMARTPEIAEAIVRDMWDAVLPITRTQIAEMQAIADAQGAGFELMPWDRLYYAEQLRRTRFGLDAEAVKPYLTVDNVLAALFDQAKQLHDLDFTHLPQAPVLHPDVRVYQVSRGASALGVMYFDLVSREGKMRGSWQYEVRTHESFRGEVLPISNVCSGLMPACEGEPVTMGWEYANVLFHEFGHGLHMLMSRAAYPSLGPCTVPWDFIEVPSLLNEHWLTDRALIRRHLRHWQTGEAMPESLIDAVEAGKKFDRVFSVNLDYLAPALTDLRLHRIADGRVINPVTIESELLAELDMPAAMDPMMTVTNAYHTWTESYAAGLYVYLWADVIAADLANAFEDKGLYDSALAQSYLRDILGSANTVPVDEAFRRFRGRDPDTDALKRRFELVD
jgi:peptidyl-dipeptidase Dcp